MFWLFCFELLYIVACKASRVFWKPTNQHWARWLRMDSSWIWLGPPLCSHVLNYDIWSSNFAVILPEIRTSDNAIDKSRPLPTSLQKDFIPEDVLFALTQPPTPKESLGPSSRFKNLNTSTVRFEISWPINALSINWLFSPTKGPISMLRKPYLCSNIVTWQTWYLIRKDLM